LREWLPEAVLLVVTTGAGIWAAGRWIDPCGDTGYAWSLAYRLSRGESLYRDIFTQYTPLTPYLLAAGARLFGVSARYYLLANWIPAVIAGLLLVRGGRRFLSMFERLVLVGVVLGTSLLLNGPGRLVFPYNAGAVHALALSVGALLLIRPEAQRVKTRAAVAGCLAGLAFACKQEVGLAVLVALCVAALAGISRPFTWVTRMCAGFLVALLPTAVFILSSAPIESLRQDSHLWPLGPPPPTTAHFMSAAAGLNNPHWPAAARATVLRDLWRAALLAFAALLLARERQRSTWLRVGGLFAGLGLWWLIEGHSRSLPLPSLSLSMSIAFAVAILALLARNLPGRSFLVALATFAGLVGARAAFSPTITRHYAGPAHFASALTTVAFLVVFLPRLLLGESRSATYLRTITALLLLAVSWRQTGIGIQSLRFPSHVALESQEGRIFIHPKYQELFNAIARDSRPGERLLALPETYAVDALFRLVSVSPFVEVLPGWLHADGERRLIERMEKSPPELVVLFQRPFKEFGSEPFGVGYGLLLADWCERNYRVVESFPAGKILRHR
jgi:hypothetical protein